MAKDPSKSRFQRFLDEGAEFVEETGGIPGSNGWSDHDEAVFTTYEIIGYIAHDMVPPRIASTFRLAYGGDEVLVASGLYSRSIFGTGGLQQESGRWTPNVVRGYRKVKGLEARRNVGGRRTLARSTSPRRRTTCAPRVHRHRSASVSIGLLRPLSLRLV